MLQKKEIKGKDLSLRAYSVEKERVNDTEFLCSILFVDIQML